MNGIWSVLRKLFSDVSLPQVEAPNPQQQMDAKNAARGRTIFRASQDFFFRVRMDLVRPHAFAHERVGFISVRAARGAEGLVLIADEYFPVADEDYIDDPRVGAMMNQEALRKALELALLKEVGVFHVHMHGLTPHLWFSSIDLREQAKFVPDFFSVCSHMPHGAIVLNPKAAAGRVWLSRGNVVRIDEFNEVGPRTLISRDEDGRTGFYV